RGVRGGPPAGARGAHSGDVRVGRHPANRPRPGEGALAPARAELQAATGDRRPRQLLEEWLPGRAEGTPRTLPEAQLARRPAHRRSHAGREEEAGLATEGTENTETTSS